VTGQGRIQDQALDMSFVRAGGPGGQHVNTSSTAVQLRYDLKQVDNLPPPVRERLAKLAGQRLTDEHVIVLDARAHRSQERNRRDALERLQQLLDQAWERPRPRIATRPGRNAKRRRMDTKTKHGSKKKLRKRPIDQ